MEWGITTSNLTITVRNTATNEIEKSLINPNTGGENPQAESVDLIAYSSDYESFFENLAKAREHVQKRFPEVRVELMYNLAGPRGFATVQTHYPSLADYERIDAELDRDEAYRALLDGLISGSGEFPVDQFYRVIQ